MKTLILLSALSCFNVEHYVQDGSGKGSFEPSDLSIVIEKSASGNYGFNATISSQGQVRQEPDVQLSMEAPEKVDQLEEMTSVLLPDARWKDVHSVRVGNVGVNANQQDAGGIYLFELLSKEGQTLGKIMTVGWSFGRCN